MIREFAPAKINLALHVTGQRADGYHLLDSLVVFGDAGDVVTLTPSDAMSLEVSGPFAAGVPTDARNLMWRAAELVAPRRAFAMTLEKNLPHPAGIGGGSADAAAVVRAIARMDGGAIDARAVVELGADVPVCLSCAPQHMRGVGEALEPVSDLPEMALVLVNPGVDVPTPAVFKSLTRKDNPVMESVPRGAKFAEFQAWLARQRNDLEAPALSVAPVIGEVLKALRNAGAPLARMSGSGATCFGIFPTLAEAERTAKALEARPWWTRATGVRGADFSQQKSDQSTRATT